MLTIYTDGSTREKNQRGASNKGGFGYVVYENGNIIDAYSEQIENTTNNEMELMALVNVIERFGTEDTWGCPEVYSDSMYAINCLTNWADNWELNNWYRSNGKPVENLALIQKGHALLKSNTHNVNISYCKGHSGIEGNELADKLAVGEITAEEVLLKYSKQELKENKKNEDE